MTDIRFETGVVSFTLNDSVEVAFNPTDSVFVEKIFDTFNELDKKQDAYKAEIDKCADKKEIFEIARRRDAEMREMVDGLFEKPVCSALFGSMNVYALADGLPVWCNLMLAVIDQIDTTFSREQKRTNPRISKYTERWKK
nr:MAG TPA: tail assembly chaperone [Bacteriophage sp.]